MEHALATSPPQYAEGRAGKGITLPEQIENNGQALDALAQAVTTLESRLSPVLPPPNDGPTSERLHQIAGGSESPLAGTLRGHQNALQELLDRVQSLGARVEL